MTSRDPKKVKVVTPKIFEASHLRNRARYTYDYNWPPIENSILRVKWPRDW